MHDPLLMMNSVIAIVIDTIRRPSGSAHPVALRTSDRGAVSIEQVLWYAAAAISVAVVAAIIWSQIKTTASTPVQSPSAP